MHLVRSVLLALPLAAAVGCGGGGSSSTAPSASAARIADATPSSDALSVALASSSSSAMPSSTATAQAALAADMGGGGGFPPVTIGADGCHPHLFLRTEAVARRLNRHLYKFLGRIDALIASTPILDTSGQMVWEKVTSGGLDERFTLTKVADLTYSWALELRQGTAGAFTTVFSGQIDRTAATAAHQGKGDLTLDLTALHGVVPAEPAQGTIQVAFDVTAASRLVVLDAAGVTWDTEGDPDDLDTIAPRDAHYVYLAEPGKGGSLKLADQMVFLCPANPTLAQSNVDVVHRWYDLSDGSVHGRSDALATGGQLGATQQLLGVTCHTVPAPASAGPSMGAMGSGMPSPVEGYWLEKLEDGGAVVAGSAQQGGSPDTCDPLLGAVPAADSTSGDFDFSAVSFTDSTPYPFPGM